MNDAGAGDDDAGLGTANQVAGGLGRIGGGLLVAHADVLDALFLGIGGELPDREADDAEHVVNALLLERAGEQERAGDGFFGGFGAVTAGRGCGGGLGGHRSASFLSEWTTA